MIICIDVSNEVSDHINNLRSEGVNVSALIEKALSEEEGKHYERP